MGTYFIMENSNSPHEEGIETLAGVLKKKKHNVVLILNRTALDRVNKLKLLNKITPSMLSSKETKTVKKARGVVIYNTVSVRNSLIVFVMSFFIKRNAYYIRNANSWLFFSNHAGSVKYKIFRFISTLIKKILLKKSEFLVVESDKIQQYLSSYTDIDIKVIPFKYSKFLFKPTDINNERIELVVPGEVDLERKLLIVILDALRALSKAELLKIQVVFLGKAGANNLLCKDWKMEFGDSFVFFEDFVPIDIFEHYIQRSTYIISCMKLDHKCRYLNEVYGTTKGSGVFGQAISYGKPLIINSGFNVPKEIETSTIFYSDADDLSTILSYIIANAKYNESMLEKSQENAKKFTLEAISKKVDLT